MTLDKRKVAMSLLCLQMCFTQISSFGRIYSSSDGWEAEIEIKTTDHLSLNTEREKRATKLPHELSIEIPVNKKRIRLALQRNHHINHLVQVTVERNGHIIRHNVADEQTIGYYFEQTNGSSFMIQRSKRKEREYEFFGTFNIGHQTFLTQPPDDKYKTHTISKAPKLKIFNEDPILHPYKEPVEELNFNTGDKREKRSVENVTYEIEVLLVVDFSVYSFWYDRATGLTRQEKDTDAKKNLRQYYALLLNAMDLRYKSVTGRGYTMKLLFAGIHIADTPDAASWTEDIKKFSLHTPVVNSYDAVKNFLRWENYHFRSLPGHDHAMLITMYDLEYSGSRSSRGWAFFGGVCNERRVSVIEDTFVDTTATAGAHEIGHNLNSRHDGDGNRCLAGEEYVMDASMDFTTNGTINRRQWVFSSCSLDYFTSYISNLNRGHTNCMSTRSASYNAGALNEFANDLLGQIYNPDDQCEAYNGKGSYMCRKHMYSDYSRICWRMSCSALENNGTCWIKMPWDGTSCGSGKLCYKGSCVASPLAPKNALETCIFGDQPGHVANRGKSCHALINVDSQHYACYYHERECCDTCATVAKLYANINGCLYGDKDSRCKLLKAYECYNSDVTCCSHCKQFHTGIMGCEYGDRHPDCEPNMCSYYNPYDRKYTCCSSCSKST